MGEQSLEGIYANSIFSILQGTAVTYSAIHKAAGSLVTGRSQKKILAGMTPQGLFPH